MRVLTVIPRLALRFTDVYCNSLYIKHFNLKMNLVGLFIHLCDNSVTDPGFGQGGRAALIHPKSV